MCAARLATFISQMCDGRMQTVSIRYSGEISAMNLNYLTSVIVRSLLMPVLREGINLVNAMHGYIYKSDRNRTQNLPLFSPGIRNCLNR